jgi:two-component system, OmpR family, sensor histidine kinase MtrB
VTEPTNTTIGAGQSGGPFSGSVDATSPMAPTTVAKAPPTSPAPTGTLSIGSAAVRRERDDVLPDAYIEGVDQDLPPSGQSGWLRRFLPAPIRRLQIGLASRTTFALALGALLVSVIVSLLTFIVARSAFTAENRRAAERTAFTNADEVQQSLAQRTARTIRSVVRQQDRPGQASTIVVRGARERYVSNEDTVSLDLVPQSVQDKVDSTEFGSGWQIVRDAKGSRLIVGIRLPSVSASFYQVVWLADLDQTLRNLGRALALAGLASTLAAAVLGRSVSRRVVRPLRDVAGAAAEIARGRLETRLVTTGDTDLDPLVNSFNDMASSLQNRIEREVRFASDVSHELRTPLTALSAAVELLEGRRDELGERNQKIVDVLGNQTRHFRRLVLDLLEISRFDANAAELVVEVFDLPSFVGQLVGMQESEAVVDATGLIDDEVRLDKRRVERIVANYLQNAANYASGATRIELIDLEPQLDPIVSTSTIVSSLDAEENDHARPGRRILIAVEDDGPGVAEDQREVLFERFRRGTAHQRGSGVKGTGLGLALVVAHAQLHGGRAWVESSESGGARFCAELVEP